MSIWSAVLIASLICLAFKAAGYLVPASWSENQRALEGADLLTVALLAALVSVQTLAGPAAGVGTAIIVDARVPAVLVAAGLLWFRAPFLVVVVLAAVTAAALRALGLAA